MSTRERWDRENRERGSSSGSLQCFVEKGCATLVKPFNPWLTFLRRQQMFLSISFPMINIRNIFGLSPMDKANNFSAIYFSIYG